jgi:O-antigen ligase
LLFDVLTYSKTPYDLLPLPSLVGKGLTEGALAVALVLVLTINRRLWIRPNLLLVLFTILCATSAMMSLRGYFGFGSIVRWVRLFVFVDVLWLTTPWWGRRDLLLCRFHRRGLLVVLVSVAVGLVISPGKAFGSAGGGRLGGALWPIPATQVAHYAAVFTGLTVVMWLAGSWRSRWTALVVLGGLGMLVLTHTRTALLALLGGILVGGLSLFLTRKRVRNAFVLAVVVGGLALFTLAPFLSNWFARGENAQQLNALTGRTATWTALVNAPRTEVNTIFGYGISNDSFDGLPIDSSWLSTYLDQGIVGDVLIGLVLLTLLGVALASPPGPGKAVALFLIVYCAVASYTETGLGQPSTYFLDLAVAMSVLMRPVALRAPILSRRPSSPAGLTLTGADLIDAG